jgi:hypothetical protein
MGVLELELDDWLDPSLPKMYLDTELGPTDLILSDEFTVGNEGFATTCIHPPFSPASDGGKLVFVSVPPWGTQEGTQGVFQGE